VVEPDQIALDHRRRRQVGEQPDGALVEDELHVAVPALPRGDRVATHGVHLDVDREQVVAALRAVFYDVIGEVATVQPLALEPALHVGEADDDRVDLTGVDPRHEVVHPQVPFVAQLSHGTHADLAWLRSWVRSTSTSVKQTLHHRGRCRSHGR
jgi:hypothetical protein